MSIDFDELTTEIFKTRLIERISYTKDRHQPNQAGANVMENIAPGKIPPGLDLDTLKSNYEKLTSTDPIDQEYIRGTFPYRKIRKGVSKVVPILEKGVPNLDNADDLELYIEILAEAFQDGVYDTNEEFINNPNNFTDTQGFYDDGRLELVILRANRTKVRYHQMDIHLSQHNIELHLMAKIALDFYLNSISNNPKV